MKMKDPNWENEKIWNVTWISVFLTEYETGIRGLNWDSHTLILQLENFRFWINFKIVEKLVPTSLQLYWIWTLTYVSSHIWNFFTTYFICSFAHEEFAHEELQSLSPILRVQTFWIFNSRDRYYLILWFNSNSLISGEKSTLQLPSYYHSQSCMSRKSRDLYHSIYNLYMLFMISCLSTQTSATGSKYSIIKSRTIFHLKR